MCSAVASPEDLEALRGSLLGLSYRLLGSAHDAEDAVQETMVRALRALPRFDPTRARLSTWVHRIGTNVCLDVLKSARRRTVLMDPTPGVADGALGAPVEADAWLEPMPTARVEQVGDPADRVLSRESVRLAFLTALQHLPPRQRAALVLREVFAYSARETAEILDVTPTAVTSALQRARETLAARQTRMPLAGRASEAELAGVLDRYVTAFEAHDVQALTDLLHTDAVASMPPFAWSATGGPRIAALVGDSDSCAGARLLPCDLNGGPGFGQYRPDDTGRLVPFALVALDVLGRRITRVTTFLGTADRFSEFGLPGHLPSPRGA